MDSVLEEIDVWVYNEPSEDATILKFLTERSLEWASKRLGWTRALDALTITVSHAEAAELMTRLEEDGMVYFLDHKKPQEGVN